MSKLRIGLVLLFCSAAAMAAPCASAPLATYISLGSTGCSVGAYTFFNFGFNVLSSTGSPATLTSSDLALIPAVIPTGAGFSFVPSSGPGFSVTSGQAVTYQLTYTIDPPPPIIWGFEEDMITNTPVAPGFARINTALCTGFPFSPSCPFDPTFVSVYHDGNGDFLLHDAVDFPGLTILGVQTNIILDATAGGSSSFTSFSQFATVPEPGSLALIGSALLAGLGLRGRRR